MSIGGYVLFLAVALDLVLFVPASESSQWVLITENVRNDAFYIDRESIERTGSTVRYRRKVQFGPDTVIAETNALQEIDCQGKRMRSLQMTIQYTDGKTESIISDSWMNIEPDTIHTVFLDLLCPPGYPKK